MAFYLLIKGVNDEKAVSLRKHEFDLKININSEDELKVICDKILSLVHPELCFEQTKDLYRSCNTNPEIDSSISISTEKNSFIRYIVENHITCFVFNNFEISQDDFRTCFSSNDNRKCIEINCAGYTKDLIYAGHTKIEDGVLYFQEPTIDKFYIKFENPKSLKNISMEISKEEYNIIRQDNTLPGVSFESLRENNINKHIINKIINFDDLISIVDKNKAFKEIITDKIPIKNKFYYQFVSENGKPLGKSFEIDRDQFDILAKKKNSKKYININGETESNILLIYLDYEDLNGFIEHDRLKEKIIDRVLRSPENRKPNGPPSATVY